MKLESVSICGIVAIAVLMSGIAAAEVQSDLKLRLSAFGEGSRDLGAQSVSPDDPADEPTEAGTADLQWTLHWQGTGSWGAYLRAQGFATSEAVVLTDEAQPRRTESYAALREFWVDYRGLSSFPGEVLRIGRQRLRSPDGLWWDQDIESLRWIFDTTLLQAQLGVAESFSTYRTENSRPVAALRDRTFLYGGLDWQWAQQHYAGLRGTHAFDHGELDSSGADSNVDAKRSERELTWVGLHLHNQYFTVHETPGLSYWIEAVYQFGDREDLVAATLFEPATRQRRDVRAWSTDLGLRWRLPTTLPLNFGVAYAHGSGGSDATRSEFFEQTGLHSNRSRFTGTRSLLYRYGEALQPDIGNLGIASVFLAMPFERHDASLVYHRYRRDDSNQGIAADGVERQPLDGSRKLGEGLDLVLTRYFGGMARAAVEDGSDLRSNLRLRGSRFRPDRAYAAEALDDQYRATLELTLWF